MSTVYPINKGVGKPIALRGLKAQYIWWLCGGVLGCLFLFAVLYIAGVSLLSCVTVVTGLGGWWCWWVYRLNHRYGAYGLMKTLAAKSVPKRIRCDQRFLRA